MKRKFFTINLLVILVLCVSTSSAVGQQGPDSNSPVVQAPVSIEATVASKISYQGMLREGGNPVTGSRNLIFEFWDNSACTGASPAFTVSKPAVAINGGLLSVALEMPDRFSGVAYWLRVKVGGTALGCQELLASPYALTLRPGATIAAGYTALTLESNNGTALEATTRTSSGGAVAAISGKSTATSGGKAGVLGEIASRTDWTVGVWGRATGTSGVTSGVWGQTESTTDGARGVTGWAHGASGATVGVRGDSESPTGMGVLGVAGATSGPSAGVRGEVQSPLGSGVSGVAFATTGVSNGVIGVTYSNTDEARGVVGWAPAGSGETYGVFGLSYSSLGRGVYGLASAGSGDTIGVYGESYSPTGIGVAGRANGGWAGSFNSSSGNGVWISAAAGKTGLVVAGGSKSAVVSTENGSRLLYTEESTEVWFTDYGFGKLNDGLSRIAIDPVFAQTVNLDEPYHVFLQVYGDADVYVTNRTATGFEVRLREGDATSEFSYRIVAKRLGFEDQRLEPASWADNGPQMQAPEHGTAPDLGTTPVLTTP